VADVEPAEIEKSFPVPESATACVPFVASLALSVIVRVALREPEAEGVNTNAIVQFLPADTGAEVPQVELDCITKSFASAPETVIELIASEALPLLVRVIVEAEEAVPTFSPPNGTEPGATVTSGAVPVPVKATVCTLFAIALLLSVMVRVALRLLIAAGANVMLIVQLYPAATDVPQVLVSEKSAAFVPVMAMLLTERPAEPLLLNAIV